MNRAHTFPFGGPAAAPGTVYLVGGGPGDPGLVSLRAAQLLATATVVAYDRLAPQEVRSLCPDDAEQIYVGKLPDRHALSQTEINQLLVDRAQAGHAVVRFKGGDPFVLGRGSEEAAHCRANGVSFEVVPGVTSAIAAAAYAGIPVTHRAVAPGFAVVTGHEDPTKGETQVDYDGLARFPGTLVLLMGVGRIGEIAKALVGAGKSPETPVALVQWGTTALQRSLRATLATVEARVVEEGFTSPAVTIVGEVADLPEDISWFEQRPLHGVSVLVPRTRHQASELSARLRALGARPVEAPTIAIEAGREPERVREGLRELADGGYDWIAFTSANAVEAVFDHLDSMNADARTFAKVRIAAVGPGTAEALRGRGLIADLLPEVFTTQGLAAALQATGGSQRVFLPRADLASPVLVDALTQAGWVVSDVEAYRTAKVAALPEGVREQILNGEVDVLAFASSSTVRNTLDLLGAMPPESVKIASIGPVTSATCAELGLRVDAEGPTHDLDGLVAAVIAAAQAVGAEPS